MLIRVEVDVVYEEARSRVRLMSNQLAARSVCFLFVFFFKYSTLAKLPKLGTLTDLQRLKLCFPLLVVHVNKVTQNANSDVNDHVNSSCRLGYHADMI